jgi:hypothetical protein
MIFAALLVTATAAPADAQQPGNPGGVPLAVRAAPGIGMPGFRPPREGPAWIEPCGHASVSVAGATQEERKLVCEAAADALALLASCRIAPRRRLHVEVAPAVRNPFGGAIFGRFDPALDLALLSELATVAPLAADTPYSRIPPAAFYKSLVVHEVVHAVMYQNYRRAPSSRAASEYPAYALQIASLEAPARETFLRAADRGPQDGRILFNDFILAFDPYFFAARAYEHFSAGGCPNLRALLDGDVQFVVKLE